MRASFLLVLTLALLVGLGVAMALRYSGFLNPPVVQTVMPPVGEAKPPPPPPPPPVRVLALTRNVFAGDALESTDVYVRPATAAELKAIEAAKGEYLAPMMSIAYFRTASTDLLADTPLKKSDLAEMTKPEALHARLTPGTRALGVAVPKPQSVGGLIQVGDWVDVYVTTNVSRTDLPVGTPYTGLVAKAVQVVAKRDTLHKIYSGLTSDLVAFTLAANPYRTALIEYARTVGVLSLVPVSGDEKKKLDALNEAAMRDPEKAVALTIGNTDIPEGREEARRVSDYTVGKLGIGTEDLARILDLKPIPVPPPQPLPMYPPPQPVEPPPPAPTTIELYNGATKQPPVVFGPPVVPVAPMPPPLPIVVVQQPPPPPRAEYVFTKPEAPPPAKKPAGK